MKSGASSAKRKAKQAAAAQYQQAFSEINPIDDIGNLSTGNLRSVNDQVGDNASATSRNQARKLDSIAKSINSDDEYKRLSGLFNARYDILKQQISNQKTNKLYSVNNGSQIVKAAAPAPTGAQTYTGMSGINNNQASMTGTSPVQNVGMLTATTPKEIPRFTINTDNTFGTKEEALKAAQKIAQERGGNVDPNSLVGEFDLPQFGALYKNLNLAEDAVGDFNALSGKINNTATSAAVEQYSTIAEKLRKRLSGEADRIASPTGLLASSQEVLTGTPYSEVIR